MKTIDTHTDNERGPMDTRMDGTRAAAAAGTPRRRGGRRAAWALPAAALLLAACDTDVTNPGPVDGEFLREPDAQPALVAGAARAYIEGHNWIGYTSAAVSREIHPAGSTGSFGISVRWQGGRLERTDAGLNTHWQNAQRARWLAERAIQIIEEEGATSQDLLAEAYLWAGYANRLMGDMYCETTINGSAPQPNTVHYERAEQQFSRAMELGGEEIQQAARAGRASIRVATGDWGGAVADANGVTASGVLWHAEYFDGFGDDQRNRITWASFAEPYKAHTEWNTKYQTLGFNEEMNPDGDPRTPWRFTPEVGDAALACCGNVSWWPQQKYPNPEDDIPLSKGAEMRLIEAESMLMNGQWQEAIAHINATVRGPAGVAPIAASSSDEAWTLFKRERGIALWLEARRLPDFRRWAASGTPGALDPLEVFGGGDNNLEQQDLCFPIAVSEQETNPNVPLASTP